MGFGNSLRPIDEPVLPTSVYLHLKKSVQNRQTTRALWFCTYRDKTVAEVSGWEISEPSPPSDGAEMKVKAVLVEEASESRPPSTSSAGARDGHSRLVEERPMAEIKSWLKEMNDKSDSKLTQDRWHRRSLRKSGMPPGNVAQWAETAWNRHVQFIDKKRKLGSQTALFDT